MTLGWSNQFHFVWPESILFFSKGTNANGVADPESVKKGDCSHSSKSCLFHPRFEVQSIQILATRVRALFACFTLLGKSSTHQIHLSSFKIRRLNRIEVQKMDPGFKPYREAFNHPLSCVMLVFHPFCSLLNFPDFRLL